MESPQRVRAWKAIGLVLGLLLVIGLLVFPFMASRVEQRELECAQSCASKGFTGYRYLPPTGGGRLVGLDKCECVRTK
jgi:hypothetical protein